jgi:VCBS repeat protein/centrosomal CEP192-like protein
VSQVVAADFNNDGKMDLAVLNQGAEYTCNNSFDTVGSEYVSTFMGNGDGTFTAGGSLQLDCITLDGGANYALTAADFNGDGHPDLAVSFTGIVECCGDYRWAVVFLGNGDGTFSSSPTFGSDDAAYGLGVSVAADFNVDGNMDLAIEGGDFGLNIYAFEGKGDGTFPAGAETTLDPAIDGVGSSWLAAGDFNNDGVPDLIAPPLNGLPTILLGNGDGTFTPVASQPTISSAPPVLGDFNDDGNLDVISSAAVLLGNGDGTFVEQNESISGSLAADLNGDGKLDLIGAGPIYLGNGDGTFQTGLDIGFGGAQVAVADFNGDGRLDLVTLNSPNTITILLEAPAAVALPGSLKFGKLAVGKTSKPLRVSLTNTGSAALHLSSFIASGDFSQTNNCGTILPLGQTCSIQVVFRPTEFGLRTGNVTITDNASDSPQVIQLSGTGAAGFD